MNALGLPGNHTREPNYGPPTSPSAANFYGHFTRRLARRRFRINQLHEQALHENSERSEAARKEIAQ